MARPVLPTDFKDDVLAESMSGKRRYRIIQNADGTVSLDDVTDYEQVGSVFGAKQVNDMSSAVNSIEDVKAANNCTTTEPGFVLDARQGKTLMDKSNELSRDLTRVNVYVGGDGKMHFVNSGGADSVLNFNKGKLYTITGIAKGWSGATFSADLKTVCDNWADVKEENIGYGIRSFGKLGGSGNSPGKLTKLGYANGVFTVRVDADLNDCTIDIYFIA